MNTLVKPLRLTKPIFRDNRGTFIEQFNADKLCTFEDKTCSDFLGGIKQVSESFSKARTFRGFHYQLGMSKIMRVIQGSAHILTFDTKTQETEFFYLSELKKDSESLYSLFVPDTHAVGFIVWEDTIMQYFHSQVRYPHNAKSIHYQSVLDSAKKQHGEDWLGILFNETHKGILISDQDKNAPSFEVK